MFRGNVPCTNLFDLPSFTAIRARPGCRLVVAILPAALLHFATLRFRYVRTEEICDSLRRKVFNLS